MPELPSPITSRTNTRVKALRGSLSGAARRSGDLLGIEGEQLIGEAHRAGFSFDTVYLRQGSENLLQRLPWMKDLRANAWVVLSPEVFDGAVSTATPQGVAATAVVREPSLYRDAVQNVLVLEDVQDPGNVGTLIRSAEAFGAYRVMVTQGTANPWNPKVVRAAAGSLFRIPVKRGATETILEELRSEGLRLFAAVAHFTGAYNLAARHGVLTGRVENSSASEEMRYSFPPTTQGAYAASFSFDTDFTQPFAIVVGNEGAGLSAKALELCDEQVLIPGGSESLNAAVAGSILLYEAMRQIDLRLWARRHGLRP